MAKVTCMPRCTSTALLSMHSTILRVQAYSDWHRRCRTADVLKRLQCSAHKHQPWCMAREDTTTSIQYDG